MYSAKSFQLTKEEYDYLLPAVPKSKLYESADRYYFIANDIDDLVDIEQVEGSLRQI